MYAGALAAVSLLSFGAFGVATGAGPSYGLALGAGIGHSLIMAVVLFGRGRGRPPG